MISITELFKPEDITFIDRDSMLNLKELHFKLNFIRTLYGEPMTVTSGFRTPQEQKAIYEKMGKPPKMGSMHLFGAAADIYDPEQKLQKWTLDHLEIVEGLYLFMESFDSTKTWCHYQILPYASWISGKSHFFQP